MQLVPRRPGVSPGLRGTRLDIRRWAEPSGECRGVSEARGGDISPPRASDMGKDQGRAIVRAEIKSKKNVSHRAHAPPGEAWRGVRSMPWRPGPAGPKARPDPDAKGAKGAGDGKHPVPGAFRRTQFYFCNYRSRLCAWSVSKKSGSAWKM